MNKKSLLTPERKARIYAALDKRREELWYLNFTFPIEEIDDRFDKGSELLKGYIQGWEACFINNSCKAWRAVLSDLEDGIEFDMNNYENYSLKDFIFPEDFK